jgi:hypothetical protein
MQAFRLLFITSLFLLASCSKDDGGSIANQYWSCNHKLGLDSASAHARLLGKWRYDRSYDASGHEHKMSVNQDVMFNDDGTYSLFVNDQISSSGRWRIKIVKDMPQIVSEPAIPELYTAPYFCGDEMMFSYSHVDGADFLLRRR